MAQNFAERLRAQREMKGLSQAELAKRSGLQPSAVSHFETGRRAPSFDNLRRLADALSVTIDYLLNRAEEPCGAGPVAEKLFRDFAQLSADDQESLSKMAELLADKNRKRAEDQSP